MLETYRLNEFRQLRQYLLTFQRLKHVTPRQSDLELQDVFTRFHEKQIQMEKVAFKERFLEQERIREQQQKERKLLLDRSRAMRLKQSEMVARIQ